MAVRCGYRTSEVARLTGLSLRQLDYWDRTGFIRPSLVPASGRGSARFYSFRDLVRLRVAAELRRVGVPLGVLRRIVDRLGQMGIEDPLSEASLVVAGGDVLLAGNSRELVSVLKAPGQGVLKLVLDLPMLVEELKQRAAAVEKGVRAGVGGLL